MFSFYLPLMLLTARKVNISDPVIDFSTNNKSNIHKMLILTLTTRIFSTLVNKEKKAKRQKSGLRYAPPATALFITKFVMCMF